MRRFRHSQLPAPHIVMLLENNPYPLDVRVRAEAESLARAGYRVRVVAPRSGGQSWRELVEDVEVLRFQAPEAQGDRAGAFLREYLAAGRALHLAGLRALAAGAAAVHIHNPPDIFFGVGAAYRASGRKVVFDHHDLFPETLEQKLGAKALVGAARMCERLTYAVAHHVVVTNESYAERARTRGAKRADAVTVVRNGPPSSWLEVPGRVRAGALGSVRLGYVGAMSSQDGILDLVPLLALIRGQGVTPSLVVIGDGDERAKLVQELRRVGLDEQVTITGWVPHHEIPRLLREVDICIDPAPVTEANTRSTMIKIAEYLTLGKPVVAYRLLETERTAGQAALLAPPADRQAFATAVCRLARSEELRTELGRAARARAQDLVWSRSEEALLSVYHRLLGPPGAP